MTVKIKAVILVSANAEWMAVRDLLPFMEYASTPYGEWFEWQIGGETLPVMQASEPGHLWGLQRESATGRDHPGRENGDL
jgi:hypothetical protein